MSTKTKKAAALAIMKRRWLTMLQAVELCGLASLSQRCTELRREGHNIISRRVKGQPYSEYRCVD